MQYNNLNVTIPLTKDEADNERFLKLKKKLSIVIPVYNEEKSLKELIKEIGNEIINLDNIDSTEIIFIDDGSMDNSFKELLEIKKDMGNVKIIQFRSNFGKTTALAKAFDYANGDYLITLDADLQDDPKEIVRFLKKLEEGYDLISGWKEKRKDSPIRVIGSKIFNYTISKIAGVKLHDFNCGFKIYRKELYKALTIYGEQHRFIPMIANKMGYKVGEILVHHRRRKYGKSKYPAFRFNALFDAVSIFFLYSHKNVPFRLFSIISLLLFIFYIMAFAIIILNMIFNSSPDNNNENICLFLIGIFSIIGTPLLIISNGLIADLMIHINYNKHNKTYLKHDNEILKTIE